MKESEEIKEQRRKDIETVIKILVRDVEVTHKLHDYYFWRHN
jgi:hypothetical protein